MVKPRPSAWSVALGALLLSLGLCSLVAPRDARAAPRARSEEELSLDGDLDLDDLVGRGTIGRAMPPRAPGGETWLTLGGFTRTSTDGPREIGGVVIVGLALDRMARQGARAGLGVATAPSLAVASAGAVEEAPAGASPRLARAAVEAAWRAAGLGGDDARLDAIVSRARWSGLLPETRLRAIRFDDQRLYTETTAADAPRLRDSAGANLGLEARLTWRFDRLLYADDEPSFERMRLERHDARARIASRVLSVLFQWHRAQLELRYAAAASREAREPSSRDEVEAALRLTEAAATLDVLTAGWFSAARGRAVVPRPPSPPVPAPLPAAL